MGMGLKPESPYLTDPEYLLYLIMDTYVLLEENQGLHNLAFLQLIV